MGVTKSFPALQVSAYFEGEPLVEPPLKQVVDGPMPNNVSDTLFDNLAAVTNAVGTPQFYNAAASCVATMLDSERYLVIRYAKYSKPEFLVNTAMAKDAVSDYLSSFYRIDPLLRMVRKGARQQVLTFDQLKKSGTDTLFYDELFRSAQICQCYRLIGSIHMVACAVLLLPRKEGLP